MRERKVHELKTWPDPFLAIEVGRKTYEVRNDDRGLGVGDLLVLREWDPDRQAFTGRMLAKSVTYKTEGGQWGIPAGLCVLALGPA